jgi:hypothetical protein
MRSPKTSGSELQPQTEVNLTRRRLPVQDARRQACELRWLPLRSRHAHQTRRTNHRPWGELPLKVVAVGATMGIAGALLGKDVATSLPTQVKKSAR